MAFSNPCLAPVRNSWGARVAWPGVVWWHVYGGDAGGVTLPSAPPLLVRCSLARLNPLNPLFVNTIIQDEKRQSFTWRLWLVITVGVEQTTRESQPGSTTPTHVPKSWNPPLFPYIAAFITGERRGNKGTQMAEALEHRRRYELQRWLSRGGALWSVAFDVAQPWLSGQQRGL